MLEDLKTEEVLGALKEARKQFTPGGVSKVKELTEELVRRKVYPGFGNKGRMSACEMVQHYGVDWNQYSGVLNCPHCNADFRDLENGPPFKRCIMVCSRGMDMGTHYVCPDCNKEFSRFYRG